MNTIIFQLFCTLSHFSLSLNKYKVMKMNITDTHVEPFSLLLLNRSVENFENGKKVLPIIGRTFFMQ